MTISIFAIAFVMIGAIYVGITTAQNRAKVSVEYLNEGQLTLEQIAREIRGKTIDVCPSNCVDAHSYICLTDLANAKTFIRFYKDSANPANNAVQINRGTVCNPNATWTRLSAPSMIVSDLQFWSSSGIGDQQPLTTILMTVEPLNASRAATPIHLQTSISSRVFLPAKPVAP